jgi:hypothetical protein
MLSDLRRAARIQTFDAHLDEVRFGVGRAGGTVDSASPAGDLVTAASR